MVSSKPQGNRYRRPNSSVRGVNPRNLFCFCRIALNFFPKRVEFSLQEHFWMFDLWAEAYEDYEACSRSLGESGKLWKESQSGETSSKTTDAPRLVDLQWNPDKAFFFFLKEPQLVIWSFVSEPRKITCSSSRTSVTSTVHGARWQHCSYVKTKFKSYWSKKKKKNLFLFMFSEKKIN